MNRIIRGQHTCKTENTHLVILPLGFVIDMKLSTFTLYAIYSCDIHQSIGEITGRLTGPLLAEEVKGLSDAVHCPTPRLVQRIVNRLVLICCLWNLCTTDC